MKKGIQLIIVFLITLINATYAQNKITTEGKLNIYLTLPAHKDFNQKYSFGGGGALGVVFNIPAFKSSFVPQIGFDFMPRGVGTDDTYRENIFFFNLGGEALTELYATDKFKLLPFVGIDFRQVKDYYQIANGNIILNSNGTSNLDYDKQPPIFASSSVAFILGLENRIGNFCVRLSYEFFNPEVSANLEHSYDAIDDEIFDNPNRRLNLSMIKVGVGSYFGSSKSKKQYKKKRR